MKNVKSYVCNVFCKLKRFANLFIFQNYDVLASKLLVFDFFEEANRYEEKRKLRKKASKFYAIFTYLLVK